MKQTTKTFFQNKTKARCENKLSSIWKIGMEAPKRVKTKNL